MSTDSLNITLIESVALVVLSVDVTVSHRVPVDADSISGATVSILKLALVVVTV